MRALKVVGEHIEAGTAGAEDDDMSAVLLGRSVGEADCFFHAGRIRIRDAFGITDGCELGSSCSDENPIGCFLFQKIGQCSEVVSFI